jgi:RNA polymerase sigma factor (sigma-70 family)
MGRVSIPLLTHYLHRLTSRFSDPSTDHELLRRFVAHREESAFAALVERHAAMVQRLCRSILRNHHDAEDIFQAVFLVLARKAGSIRKGDSVGGWLYAVAYRLAHKARLRASKRDLYEQRAAIPREQTPMDQVTWGELRDVVHEEVSRLPEKYRAAIVLCYWEGRTHEQAGRQLGCAKSTIKDRLERAREMLRTRLARRGLALSAAWFAAALSEGTSASVALVQTTVRSAMLFSNGELPAGLVSAQAVTYAKSALQTTLVCKLKYGLALILMLGVLSGGTAMTAFCKPAAPENEPEAIATAATARNEPEAFATEEPLPAGAVGRLGTLRFRHSDSIRAIAVGPDRTSILSAAGNAVYVWDLATGQERRRFRHGSQVSSFACSRNGELLAAGCSDGTIHVWEAATGRELRSFPAHKDKAPDGAGPPGVYLSEFSSDGRLIASTAWGDALRLWDTATGEKIREFSGFSAVGGVALSPDGRSLAGVAKSDKTWELHLWETATGWELKRMPQPGKQILSPVFSPDGKILAIAIGDQNWERPCDLELWDAGASRKLHTLRGHKSWASCQFAPDGKSLVSVSSSGRDGPARLWDVNTGKEIGRIGDKLPFTQLLFCRDGQTLVSYTQCYHTFHFWDRASGKEIRSRGDPITPIDFLSFSPDGRLLATGSTGRWDIRIWDLVTRKTIRRLEHNLLSAVQFSPDGGRLASAAWTDSQVRIWEMTGGKEVRRIPIEESDKRIRRLAWSGDGKVVATWTWNQNGSPIYLWNPDTGEQLRELNSDGNDIESLVFSPDSRLLAALKVGNVGVLGPDHILLWEVETGRLLRSLELPTNPPYLNASDSRTRLAFSPDGRTLVAGGQRAEVSIYGWEVASGGLRFTLNHGDDVACVTFSPDGKFLAAANNCNAYRNNMLGLESLGLKTPLPQVHVWDLVSGKETQVLKGHEGPVSTLAFSPDGRLLATGGNDTTVLLWDATRFKTNPPAEVQLRPEQMESLWADLGSVDATKAYRSIRMMVGAPHTTATFLKRRLQPVAPADAKQVARLLADLDSEQFAVREQAMQQLEKLGDRAATELRKALAANPALEVRRRIEQLLEKRDNGERIRMVRGLEVLESLGKKEARELCATLANGVPDAPLTREARAILRRISR